MSENQLKFEDVIGKNWRILGETTSIFQKYKEEIDRYIFEGKEWKKEIGTNNKKGELVYKDVKLFSMCDTQDEITHIVFFAEDISERKKLFEQLQFEKDFNKTVIQTAPVLILTLDNFGQVIMMNEMMLSSLGYELSDVIGKIFVQHFVPESDQEQVRDTLKQIKSEEFNKGETRVLTKDGRELLIEWYGTSIFNQSTETEFIFGVGLDITRRKKVELDLKKYRAHLEELVEERTNELQDRNIQLIEEINERIQVETALQESEKNYKSLIQAVPLPIYVYQIEEANEIIFKDYNKAAFKETDGYIANMVGKNANELYADKPDILADIQKILKEKSSFEREHLFQYRNSEEVRLLHSHVAFIPPGKILLLTDDITERKLAEVAEMEQRQFSEALAKSAATLNDTLNLDEVLGLVLENLDHFVSYRAANIMLVDEKTRNVSIGKHRGYSQEAVNNTLRTFSLPIDKIPIVKILLKERKPVVIPYTKTDPIWIKLKGVKWINSYLGIPIFHGNDLIGVLNVDSDKPNNFNSTHAQHLQAFMNQAGIAIRNARLFEKTHEIATLEERQRLARDMHDVVTQTLFSASLKAEALSRLWERETPEEINNRLVELQRLNRGALAEMRTLLVELRPQSFEKSDLGDLIQQLIDGISGQGSFKISCSIKGKMPLPIDVKMVFFRIAQESLNNISKHSRANIISIDYQNNQDHVYMSINDNGRGFDIALIPPERLGIKIMEERAEKIGANLEIKSSPGKGTSINLQWYNNIT
ncbi:MAG: PAS domain S-box protein [Anaerolineaceae bacterium]|nr:PAS domain S-box protein [Anaerolineaceae bacterium]